ncbi:32853_t:CDS:1, partial [Gigaspora margarita]
EHAIVKHRTCTIPNTEPKQNNTEGNNIDARKLSQEATKNTGLARNDAETNKPIDKTRQTVREIIQEKNNQSSLTVAPGPKNNVIRDELSILSFTESKIN